MSSQKSRRKDSTKCYTKNKLFLKNNCGSSQFAWYSNNKKQQINNLNKYQNSVLNFTTIKDNNLCFLFY